MAWILFGIFMFLLSAMFVGSLCACASRSEREIERLQDEANRD